MGSIYKDLSGNITVDFNQKNLSDDEMNVFKTGISRFVHHVQIGQIMYLFELIEKVKAREVVDEETQLMLNVVEKASIEHEYMLHFFYDCHQTNTREIETMVVKCENVAHAKSLLPQHVCDKIVSVDFWGAASVYQKGRLTFNVHNQQGVNE